MSSMMLLASVVTIVTYVLLVVLEAGRVTRPTTSLFELRRRKAAGDTRAADTLKREELRALMGALGTPLKGLLAVTYLLAVIYLLGMPKGVAVVIVSVVLHARIIHLSAVRTLASKLYVRSEPRLARFVAKYEAVFRFMTGKTPLSRWAAPLGSHEELAHLLEVSHIFSDEDKKLLQKVLRFSDLTVGDIMTKQSDVVAVSPSTLLGPLVLDDLHKTKHEIFPVKKGDAVVGLLDIRDHVALRRKESVYVRDVMLGGVVHIAKTEPLDEALKVLMAAKQPYLIVTDSDERVVGLLGLGDVIRALTGWR